METLSESTATRQNIESYIQRLSSRVTENDRFLFYFSGHGITEHGPLGDVGYPTIRVSQWCGGRSISATP